MAALSVCVCAGEDKWIMAPLANHQPGAGHIQWRNNDPRTKIFEVVSDRAYRPGEQVPLHVDMSTLGHAPPSVHARVPVAECLRTLP